MKLIARVSLIALVSLGLAAEVRAQGAQPGGPLVVRDSQGRLVGQLLGSSFVSMVVSGKIVILVAARPGLTDPGAVLEFDQPNCQGNSFMLKSNIDLNLATPAVFDGAGVLHIADLATPVQTQTLMSYFQATIGACTNQSIVAADAIPAVQTSFNKSQFTPPLSVASAYGQAAAVPASGTLALAVLATGLAIAGASLLLR